MPGPAVTPGETATAVLGAWYATLLGWRRPAALLANEPAACRVAARPTANRSLVGVMNDFAHLADLDRAENQDLLRLSMRLGTTPCGPLFQRHISPDRELAAFLAGLPAPSADPMAT